MQAKHYLIILLFALIGLSNNLQAQDAKERAVVEKALKVWLENEKIKCANHFDKKVSLEEKSRPLEEIKKRTTWVKLGLVETNLLSILNKRSVELSEENTSLGEIAKTYYATLDSCLIHLPSIMEKDKPSVFKESNLLVIMYTLDSYTIGSSISAKNRDIIYMYKR